MATEHLIEHAMRQYYAESENVERMVQDLMDDHTKDILRTAAHLVALYTNNPEDSSAKMLRRVADGETRPGDPKL